MYRQPKNGSRGHQSAIRPIGPIRPIFSSVSICVYPWLNSRFFPALRCHPVYSLCQALPTIANPPPGGVLRGRQNHECLFYPTFLSKRVPSLSKPFQGFFREKKIVYFYESSRIRRLPHFEP
jgi:hypothetical protein